MNDTFNNDKNHNFEKTYPGCLGRMVNLFELNIGVSPNRLLTDKPHRDGAYPFSLCFLLRYVFSFLNSIHAGNVHFKMPLYILLIT